MASVLMSELERQMLGAVRLLRVPGGEELDERSRRVFADCRAAFGALVAPIAVHAVVPSLLDGFWTLTAATLLAASAPRSRKELVAAGVSIGNRCPYCVDAHVGALYAHGDSSSAEGILAGGPAAIRNDDARRLAEWAAGSGRRGGNGLPTMPEAEANELRATAVAFHYLNRVVSVFLPESPFIGPRFLRGIARRNMGRFLKPSALSAQGPSPSADQPPVELSWARTSPGVAHGFAAMELSVSRVGETVLPRPAMRAVDNILMTWDGAPPEPGRSWLARNVAEVPNNARSAAELALCSSVAAFRVNSDVVARARAELPSDAALFALVSWSAWQAAKKVGGWLT